MFYYQLGEQIQKGRHLVELVMQDHDSVKTRGSVHDSRPALETLTLSASPKWRLLSWWLVVLDGLALHLVYIKGEPGQRHRRAAYRDCMII